ncbi:hypothetical protein BD309DRAFT_967839 [Dichomitus squalens]|nr:hypothetical protein BD309DRAFT_967839 [Dichomitus squalens]
MAIDNMDVISEDGTLVEEDTQSERATSSPTQPKTVNALSPGQERKLVDYLEERFLDITRNFKKRADPSSSLPTLPAYLEATHHLLSLILQVPPVDPSAPLRTTLLLRLTGDVLAAVPGYVPTLDVLPLLLSWLADLDAGWLAVLRSQAWDPTSSTAVDARLPEGARASTPSQTERTRLRSLLIGGTDALEEWLERLDTSGAGFEMVLEKVGMEQAFNELFAGTLAEMGSLTGALNDPRGMEAAC